MLSTANKTGINEIVLTKSALLVLLSIGLTRNLSENIVYFFQWYIDKELLQKILYFFNRIDKEFVRKHCIFLSVGLTMNLLEKIVYFFH